MKRVLVVGSARKSNGGVSEVIRQMTHLEVWQKYHCHWLGTQIQGANRIKKLWFAIRSYIVALLIVWRYNAVHFHTVPDVSMMVQLPVFLIARVWRKKIILHLHVGDQLTMREYTKYRLAHYCMRRADRLVLLSPLFLKYMDEYWHDVSTPKTIIPNPCGEVEALPYHQHKKTILFAGRFTSNKRADILISAFGRVHHLHPGWKVQILAHGYEEARCRKLVRNLGLEHKVEMPGIVLGRQKADYFRHAAIFCLCSHFEGMPMAIIEAWAYGIPIVSTPVGAIPSIVEEGKNGFIYAKDDVDSLACILDRLMGDERLRADIGNNGKAFVEQNFAPAIINSMMDKLYQEFQ